MCHGASSVCRCIYYRQNFDDIDLINMWFDDMLQEGNLCMGVKVLLLL